MFPTHSSLKDVHYLAMSFTQIDSDCKLAREYALLGNYDTAMVYYQGVLQEVRLYSCVSVLS